MANNYSPIMPNFGSAQNTTNPNLGSNTANLLMSIQKSREEEAYKSQLMSIQKDRVGLEREQLLGDQEQQKWLRGAPERAVKAEQQLFDLKRQRDGDQSKAISQFRTDTIDQQRKDFKFSDKTIAELQSSSLFKYLPELAQKQYIATTLGQVKEQDAAFVNKGLLNSDLRQFITDSGYGEEAATSSVKKSNASLFPTSSLEMAKLRIDALGKPISDAAQLKLLSGGRGSNGSNGYFDVTASVKADEYVNNFYNNSDERSSAAGVVGADTNLLDWKGNEVYKDRVRTVVSDLAPFGINEVSSIKALQSIAIRDGVITDKFKGINSDAGLSVPLMKELISKANDFQKLSQRGGSQAKDQKGILNGMVNLQNSRTNSINSIFGTLNNEGLGRDGRSKLLSSDSNIKKFAETYGYNLPAKEDAVAELFPATKNNADTPTGNILSTGLPPEEEIADQIDRMEKYNTFEEYLDQEKPRTNIKTDDLRKLFARMESSYESTQKADNPNGSAPLNVSSDNTARYNNSTIGSRLLSDIDNNIEKGNSNAFLQNYTYPAQDKNILDRLIREEKGNSVMSMLRGRQNTSKILSGTRSNGFSTLNANKKGMYKRLSKRLQNPNLSQEEKKRINILLENLINK